MRFPSHPLVVAFVVASCIAPLSATAAEIEATTSDGRRVVLDDGNSTWRYADDAAKGPGKDEPMAVLRLERRIERGNNCRFEMRLINNLPYEIRSFVPYYSAYKANGVVYDSVSGASSFGFLKPGDAQTRDVEFNGIPCKEIVRVQVVGGDRCDMGDLDKFTTAKGQCLARVHVLESDVVRFDK